jgi:transcriptional regulator GlxA family with amidase domain
MDWAEGLRLLVLRADLQALRSLATRIVTNDSDHLDLRFDPAMDAPQITATALGQARMMQDLLASDGPEAVNPLAAAALREQVMFTLLLGQSNSLTPALRRRPGPARRSTVGDAAELMRVRADEPLTIEEVARAVGLSVRALHAGFRRELDRSPKQYLQQIRLERAHAALVAAEPGAGPRVIDVAYRWGFSHPGRFATAYRATYGEPPAATLARSLRT